MDDFTLSHLRELIAQAKKVFALDISYRDDAAFPSVLALEFASELCRTENVVASVPDIFHGYAEPTARSFRIFIETEKGQQEFAELATALVERKAEIHEHALRLVTLGDLDPDDSLLQNPAEQRRGGKSVKIAFGEIKSISRLMTRLAEFHHQGGIFLEEPPSPEELPKAWETLRILAKKQALVLKKMREVFHNVTFEALTKVFAKSAKIANNLATAQGKIVNVAIVGSEILVDKLVVEYLRDALLHVVRNAVDHGIETPSERVAAGKDAAGTITISARSNGDAVIIDVHDDGRGIATADVRKIAGDQGFVDHAQLALMSDEDVLNLVFLPRFSTNSELTETSGRGVGLDAVKTNISIVGGDVRLHSESGRGTTCTITLPKNAADAVIASEETDLPSEDDYLMCIAEIDELLQLMDKGLEELPHASDRAPIFQELYRNAHTIKGLAAFCKEDDVVHVCHRLEDTLDCVVEGQLEATLEVEDAIASAVAVVSGMVAGMSVEQGFDIDTQPVMEQLHDLMLAARTKQAAIPNPQVIS